MDTAARPFRNNIQAVVVDNSRPGVAHSTLAAGIARLRRQHLNQGRAQTRRRTEDHETGRGRESHRGSHHRENHRRGSPHRRRARHWPVIPQRLPAGLRQRPLRELWSSSNLLLPGIYAPPHAGQLANPRHGYDRNDIDGL
jgi:hypothetical protein